MASSNATVTAPVTPGPPGLDTQLEEAQAEIDALQADVTDWAALEADVDALQGDVAVLQGAAGWKTLCKPADQVIANSATLADDDTLSFAMAASAKYRVRGTVFFDATVLGGMKYTFTGPASPSLVRAQIAGAAAGAVPALAALLTDYPSGAGVALTGSGTAGGYLSFEFVIHNGANAGTFKFRFAQNAALADSGAVVRAGSWLEYSTV